MTQVIACSTQEGIVLAADGLATWFDPTGGMRHFSLMKILRLSSRSALVSAGRGIGAEGDLQRKKWGHPSILLPSLRSVSKKS